MQYRMLSTKAESSGCLLGLLEMPEVRNDQLEVLKGQVLIVACFIKQNKCIVLRVLVVLLGFDKDEGLVQTNAVSEALQVSSEAGDTACWPSRRKALPGIPNFNMLIALRLDEISLRFFLFCCLLDVGRSFDDWAHLWASSNKVSTFPASKASSLRLRVSARRCGGEPARTGFRDLIII